MKNTTNQQTEHKISRLTDKENKLRLCAKSLKLHPMLCESMGYNPPSFSVHGVLLARILEWVVMPSSRDLPDPGIKPLPFVTPALQADSLPLNHQGSPREQTSGY